MSTILTDADPEDRRLDRKVVLFDLDGTITTLDSLTWFLIHTIRGSWWRSLVAIAIAPVALPLLATRRGQTLGASLFLWVASVARPRRELVRGMASFAHSYFSRSRRVHACAMRRLDQHLARGDRVIVVTGATHWLARPLVEGLSIHCPVVGSSIGACFGGLGTLLHCIGERKVQRLEQRLGLRHWDIVYTDSLRDLPLMRRAGHTVLVEPSRRLARRTRTALNAAARSFPDAPLVHLEILTSRSPIDSGVGARRGIEKRF